MNSVLRRSPRPRSLGTAGRPDRRTYSNPRFLSLSSLPKHVHRLAKASESGKLALIHRGRPRVRPTKKPGTKSRRAKTVKKTEETADHPIAAEPSRVGKRGTVVIPASLRRQYRIEEGTFVVAEPREGGVLIRPAVILPVEVYKSPGA
jgi:AbrB family looped-hinge helix DNA binding protein